MLKLLDRDVELATLEEAWTKASSGKPQLLVVWGRRRVGKTFLLSHFVQRKRALFFGATQQAEAVELSRLSEAVARDLGRRTADLTAGGFPSWESALRFFVAIAADEPLVVVLDEVPYLARSTRGFASIVQAVWDHVPPRTRLLFVLTGSAFGVIESMLGAGGALRGRPTATLRLDPVSLPAARIFLPRLTSPLLLEAYAASGGYPLHLREWDSSVSTEENLLRLAMTAGGILLEDAAGILREELPETGGYSRILSAIGRGRTRFSEITNEAGQRIEQPLEVLTRVGFVRKVTPVGAPEAARPNYEIADPYLAFWFGVLYSDIQQIEAGQGRQVLRRRQPSWERLLGWIFEEAARDHARRLVNKGEFPDDLVIGRWWATTGQPCEVDVLGLRGTKTALIGEVRWQNRPLGQRDLDALTAKVERVPSPVPRPIVALWGRNGVDRQIVKAGVRGFGIDDVLRH